MSDACDVYWQNTQAEEVHGAVNNALLDATWFASLDSTIRVGKRDGASQIHAIRYAVHLVARQHSDLPANGSCMLLIASK